jgi:two-component system, chemotaxis family, chemotaxis protein CheY
MRALVVDDSATIRHVLSQLLGSLGMDVDCCTGGAEALEYLASAKTADLLLLDWNMPDITGLDLVKAVREQIRYRYSKIMMVTSETDVELMKFALDAGADEYLMKPVNRENLTMKLGLLGLTAMPEAHHGH